MNDVTNSAPISSCIEVDLRIPEGGDWRRVAADARLNTIGIRPTDTLKLIVDRRSFLRGLTVAQMFPERAA